MMDKLKKYIYELVASKKLTAKEATEYITYLQNGNEHRSEEIAVIGISGRFPKADKVEQFWENLYSGRDCLDTFPEERFQDGQALGPGGHVTGGRFKKGGYLDEISFFDAEMFRISPKEALSMEPYQRIMLEVAYDTLVNAGYETQDILGSRTGVFIGRDHVTGIEYRNYAAPDIFRLTGGWPGILASRISYVYNLKGPSVVFDTSCSSGLVGLHFACDSLRRNECDMAFVGGISGLFYFPPVKEDGSLDQVESAEEMIRAFDKDAEGTVWGEGCGGLLLKPLSKAVADKDVIYAVIKGSGINNDGLSKGITAPNGEAQEELLKKVWKQAQVNPETIRYIETHGTGTVLGDSIELNSIINAFQAFTPKKQFCGVGSVKTNIGHLVGASGIISLIKAVLMLQHGEIPASLHFQAPSPYINLADSAVFINDQRSRLEKRNHPIRIGINSFGFSGTNCHVLLEEPPVPVYETKAENNVFLLTLSARSGQKLLEAAQSMQHFLLTNRSINLADLCCTASRFRNHFTSRVAIMFSSYEDLLAKLKIIKETRDLSRWNDHPGISCQTHEVVSDTKSWIEAWEIREGEKIALDKTANEVIKELLQKKAGNEMLWEQVARFYLKGASIIWRMLYPDGRKLAMPGNVLERTKYWPAKAKREEVFQDELYYKAEWVEEHRQTANTGAARDTVLLIVHETDTALWEPQLFRKIRGKRCILVEIGRPYQKITGTHYYVSNSAEDFSALCGELDISALEQILYAAPSRDGLPDSLEEFKDSFNQTVMNLLYLVKALQAANSLNKNLDMALITQNAHVLQPMDTVSDPFAHTLYGIGKSILQENRSFHVRHIDISHEPADMDSLLAELEVPSADYSVALRHGRRYVEVIKRADMAEEASEAAGIEAGDTFLITGGLGLLGIEVCKYLSQKNRVKLIVLGRTAIPDRASWPSVIMENEDKQLLKKINGILAIEALGFTLDYHCVDICDETQLRRTVQLIREHHGRINGVFHCAGVGVGDIEDFGMSEQEFEQRHAAKTYGSWLVHQLTEPFNTGFTLLFSSAVSITGGRGSLAYTAGNAFMDGLAETIKLQGPNVMAINWSTWEATASHLSLQEDKHFFEFLSTHQALQALDLVIRRRMFRTIVGKLNVRNKLLELENVWPFRLADEIKQTLFTKTHREEQPIRQTRVTVKEPEGYTATHRELAQVWGDILGLASISVFDSFHQLGGDSIHAAHLHKRWNERHPGTLDVTDIYRYPTIHEMAGYLDSRQTGQPAALNLDSILEGFKGSKYSKEEAKRLLAEWTENSSGQRLHPAGSDEYAIIGYACKFPMADDAEQFWRNLTSGVNAIRPFPESRRKDTDSYLAAHQISPGDNAYCQGGYLEEIDRFDSAFFHISPREGELMDPEQRLLLENVYQAAEHSGLGGRILSGTRTGVYVGKDTTGRNEYNNRVDILDPLKVTSGSTGILASRIAYYLNLNGPCLVVDTACSSSLTAICLATQALKQGQIDIAIVAGVSLAYLPTQHNSLIDSVDEMIRPFDAEANGTMWGEGAGTIILKRMNEAVQDNHVIHAVIKGSEMNNNGASNGITAPNAEAQEKVLVAAWKAANIDPETISYIEAHATGTQLGDPIEIKGITNAFRRFTNKKQFCAAGTVKANIGHLVGASGMASVIKMILAFKHKQLPPVLQFKNPNPFIEFADSPIYVNDRLQDWNGSAAPRRCGISSFGFSGTNCHILLEEPPTFPGPQEEKQDWYILALSAKTAASLSALIKRYILQINGSVTLDLRNLCFTANISRGHYEHRVVILFRTGNELRAKFKYLQEAGLPEAADHDQRIYYKASRISYDRNGDDEEGLLEEDKLKLNRLAESLMEEWSIEETLFAVDHLHKIARLYTDGADINWDRLYQGKPYRLTELPVYSYEAVRHWIGDSSRKLLNPSVKHYQLQWLPDHREESAGSKPNEGAWLFIGGTGTKSKELLSELRKQEIELIEVTPGTHYHQLAANRYSIGSGEEYSLLLKELSNRRVRNIIHCLSLADEKIAGIEDLHAAENRGVYNLYHLVTELLNGQYHQELNLFFVADHTFRVNRHEPVLSPHHAVMFGLAKVIPQEYPQFKCRCIDIDNATASAAVWEEICSGSADFQVAYRDNTRYIEHLEERLLGAAEAGGVSLQENGVYVVTGGLGGIGLAVAHYLSGKQRVHVCLLNRGTSPPGPSQIERIRQIEANGSEVDLYTADISEPDELQGVLQAIRTKYGQIHGLFHCAGIAGEGLLINKEKPEIKRVLDAKVTGTWLLDQYTAQDNLDYFVLFSSVTSLLGGMGQADYTAANAYLDVFSDYRQANNRRSVTINWPAWKEVGMTLKYDIQEGLSPFLGLTEEQGISILDAVLQRKLSRIIVGQINERHFRSGNHSLPFVVPPQIISRGTGAFLPEARATASASVPPIMPVLKGRNNHSYNSYETSLAAMWQRVLGVAEVNVYLPFQETGGNSILATSLVKEMDDVYPGCVNIATLFAYPSIAQMAEYLEQKQSHNASPQEADPGDSQRMELSDKLSGFVEGKVSIENILQYLDTNGLGDDDD
ncbi:SDR family NAD(P)-dependent oxidoreductase [Paenibacillus graminis]|nr:SDR family NAD(P)-dependent oxidoreductase [Paenibacillus graminis]